MREGGTGAEKRRKRKERRRRRGREKTKIKITTNLQILPDLYYIQPIKHKHNNNFLKH